MNRSKLLSVMPYILAILILTLVGVIIFTGLGDSDDTQTGTESQLKTSEEATNGGEQTAVQPGDTESEQTASAQAGDDTLSGSATEAGEGSESSGETSAAGTSGDSGTEAETPTAAPTPTEAPKATEAPVPTQIADLTFGYVFEKKADYVDTKDGVNLRLGCSTDTEVVAFLEEGKRLERTGYNDNWTRIIYNGQECYIATRLIIRAVDSIDAVVTPEASADDLTGETGDATETADAGETADDTDSSGAQAYASDSFTKSKWYGAGAGRTVCIDPGHQSQGNSDKEALGPGSTVMKAKCSSGTVGVSTGLAEYKLNLIVSLKLKAELEARGYTVIMTRTTNDVDLSNIERANIANEANADAFIRIHANASSNASANGIETLCMSSDSPYNAELYEDSYRLSADILLETVSRTGANERYVYPSDNYSGINWSQVPVSIVEMGYMTNAAEDELLSTDSYQNKIVVGIADGLDRFFSGE